MHKKKHDQHEIKINLRHLFLVAESPGESEGGFLMKTACFIGQAASRIHRITSFKWFRLLMIFAIIYLIMHLTGTSVAVFHQNDVLFTIK